MESCVSDPVGCDPVEKNEKGEGFVYILSNARSFKKGWLKLGRAKDVENRLRTLNTSVPYPFAVLATLHTKDMKTAEHCFHSHIKNLYPKAWSETGELFLISPEKAYRTLQIIAENRGELDGLDPQTYQGVKRRECCSAADGVEFFCTSSGANASGCLATDGKFSVARGSVVGPETPSCPARIRKVRSDLVSRGVISSDWKFTCNHEFKTASLAAGVVTGASVSAPAVWRTKKGVTLGNFLKGK